jgi:DNA adenine methylase
MAGMFLSPMIYQPAIPILKYPGAKFRLADWIVQYIPPHIIYLEPFAGSLAVFFRKAPSALEIINDRSRDVVNFFEIMRTRPDELADQIALTPWSRDEFKRSMQPCDDSMEQARRFAVYLWQGHSAKLSSSTGWRYNGLKMASNNYAHVWRRLPDEICRAAERLKNAQIENMDALDLLARYNDPSVCCYIDPPYVLETRSGAMYQHEMTNDDHTTLLENLRSHTGAIILSGYDHPLYRDLLPDWSVIKQKAIANNTVARTEVLWLNRAAQPIQARMFEL